MITAELKELILDNKAVIRKDITESLLNHLEDNVEFIGHYTAADEKNFREYVTQTIQDYILQNFTVQRVDVYAISSEDLFNLVQNYYFNKGNYCERSENYQN